MSCLRSTGESPHLCRCALQHRHGLRAASRQLSPRARPLWLLAGRRLLARTGLLRRGCLLRLCRRVRRTLAASDVALVQVAASLLIQLLCGVDRDFGASGNPLPPQALRVTRLLDVGARRLELQRRIGLRLCVVHELDGRVPADLHAGLDGLVHVGVLVVAVELGDDLGSLGDLALVELRHDTLLPLYVTTAEVEYTSSAAGWLGVAHPGLTRISR